MEDCLQKATQLPVLRTMLRGSMNLCYYFGLLWPTSYSRFKTEVAQALSLAIDGLQASPERSPNALGTEKSQLETLKKTWERTGLGFVFTREADHLIRTLSLVDSENWPQRPQIPLETLKDMTHKELTERVLLAFMPSDPHRLQGLIGVSYSETGVPENPYKVNSIALLEAVDPRQHPYN